ncbi:MAG: ankyrin repeat domain-containing protein [Candidatus Hydrogenedentes bacterium]|nr:ankyrin repeat domain-containing protein [Candidatus Hydrogenedentota bacterium]
MPAKPEVRVDAVIAESGKMALQYAVSGGHEEVAALLRERGATE